MALVSCTGAVAQTPNQLHYHGVINDYSPGTVKGGPWEMHGQWSLDLRRESDRADFAADMTMSDYGTSNGMVDATQPGQNGHTHQIKLTNAKITWSMDGCPTYSPAAKTGFQINGTVSLLTGNGTNAPFETTPPSSTLQICVTGGDNIRFSVVHANMTMVFLGAATSHFGSQPIHGVVRDTQ
jgi:hypothetical protein